MCYTMFGKGSVSGRGALASRPLGSAGIPPAWIGWYGPPARVPMRPFVKANERPDYGDSARLAPVRTPAAKPGRTCRQRRLRARRALFRNFPEIQPNRSFSAFKPRRLGAKKMTLDQQSHTPPSQPRSPQRPSSWFVIGNLSFVINLPPDSAKFRVISPATTTAHPPLPSRRHPF